MYRKIVQEELYKNIKSTEIEWITFIFKGNTISLQFFILTNPIFTEWWRSVGILFHSIYAFSAVTSRQPWLQVWSTVHAFSAVIWGRPWLQVYSTVPRGHTALHICSGLMTPLVTYIQCCSLRAPFHTSIKCCNLRTPLLLHVYSAVPQGHTTLHV